MCLRCAQMFPDVHRCFWIFSRNSIGVLLMFSRSSLDVPRMFAGFFQDVFRMLLWVLKAWWNLMIISNESMDLNDPKEFDDPRLFDDPSYSVIPSYLMIPSYSMINIKYPKGNGDTSISDGLVLNSVSSCVNLSNMKTY